MKKIKMSNGKYALVDDDWYEYLNQFTWTARQSRTGSNWYAIRHERRQRIHMHRIIANAPDGLHVDHINGDSLDNRSQNLRLATHSENLRNRGKPRNNTTGFKGVSRQKGRKNFRAVIWHDGKRVDLGWYPDARDAAMAYDRAVRKYHGEFGRTNF